MRLVEAQNDERKGKAAIHLDLVRETHHGGDVRTSSSSTAPSLRMT
jgi:hypothetical protein